MKKYITALSLIAAHTIASPRSVLIIGSGGREHAIAHAVAQSHQIKKIFVAPGNGGTAQMERVQSVHIAPTDIDGLLQFAHTHAIDITIVGPETPLALGIVDTFMQAGKACFGPSKAAAQIETSKQFAKDFMLRHGIPTAAYQAVTTLQEAYTYIDAHELPIVVKADGLAAGKGVIIAQTKAEARNAVETMLSGASFGEAGKTVVLEQFLQGHEVSFFALSDGHSVIPLTTAQDYKRVEDGDTGPNTGGMGAYSPAPIVTPKLHSRIMKKIIEPTIQNMEAESIPFVGFLYAGLMISPEGDPYVIEFNCRLGDPETQAVLPRLKTDFVSLCTATLEKKLDAIALEWDARKAVTVVIADSGYPHSTHVGQSIAYESLHNCMLFHAGTKQDNGTLISAGGRILAISCLADSFDIARKNVYEAIQNIHLPHMRFRTDIAQRVVK